MATAWGTSSTQAGTGDRRNAIGSVALDANLAAARGHFVQPRSATNVSASLASMCFWTFPVALAGIRSTTKMRCGRL